MAPSEALEPCRSGVRKVRGDAELPEQGSGHPLIHQVVFHHEHTAPYRLIVGERRRLTG